MSKIKTIVIGLVLLTSTKLSAQSSITTLQLQESLVQSSLLNPSIYPEFKVIVGLPGASSVYASGHSVLGLRDVFLYPKNIFNSKPDSIVLNIDKIYKKNDFGFEADAQLFLLGVATKRGYLTFNSRLRSEFNTRVPEEFLQWTAWGFTDPRVNTNVSLDDLSVKGQTFLETSVGYAHKVNTLLKIGAKLKYVKGIFNINMEQIGGFSLNQDSIRLNLSQATYSMAGINNLGSNNMFDYISNHRNNGVALDLGANVYLTPYMNFSMAISDIGFIRWKDNLKQYTAKDFNYSISSFKLVDYISGNESATLQQEIDTLVSKLDQPLEVKEYRTLLTAKLMMSTQFEINESNFLGISLASNLTNGRMDPKFGFTYRLKVKNAFSFITGLSFSNRRIDNILGGIVFKPGPFQFYLVTDRVNSLATFYKTKETNFRLGMNLMFGKVKK